MKFEIIVTKKESRWPLLQTRNLLTQISEQFNGQQLNSGISKELLEGTRQYIHEEKHQERLTWTEGLKN